MYRSSTALRLLVTVLAAVCRITPVTATDYHVTVLTDDDATNSNCTLREALIAATQDTSRDACPAGGASDVIFLDTAGTYTLAYGQVIGWTNDAVVTVQGPTDGARDATIDLGLSSRLLSSNKADSITFKDLSIIRGAAGDGGALQLSGNLTLLNVGIEASETVTGGGVSWTGVGTGELTITDCDFYANTSTWLIPQGGGLRAAAADSSQILIARTKFDSNSAIGSTEARGGGAWIQLDNDSSAEITDSVFIENQGHGDAFSVSALSVEILSSGTLKMTGTQFSANQAIVPGGGGPHPVYGVHIDASGTSSVVMLDRNVFTENFGSTPDDDWQLFADISGDALVSNSLFVNGTGGFQGYAFVGAQLTVSHITAADNSKGVELTESLGAVTAIYNSIVALNASSDLDAGSGVTSTSNLVGLDPSFVSAIKVDYRLKAGSPAVDAGDKTLPGTGFLDLKHGPRVVGLETDMGAFERDGIFADGFESGDESAWGADFSIVSPK